MSTSKPNRSRRVCIMPGPMQVMTQPGRFSTDIKDPRRWAASFTAKALCGAYEGAARYGRLPGEWALVRVRGRLLAAKVANVETRPKRKR